MQTNLQNKTQQQFRKQIIKNKKTIGVKGRERKGKSRAQGWREEVRRFRMTD